MFERISVNPMIMGGKPCVKGTRIAVYMILELLESDLTFDEFDEIIRNYYPQLAKEDIAACIEYARIMVEQEEIHFASELIVS